MHANLQGTTTSQRARSSSQPPPPSLGDISFAFSCAVVLLEVQNTLREPPAASVSMKKTVNLA